MSAGSECDIHILDWLADVPPAHALTDCDQKPSVQQYPITRKRKAMDDAEDNGPPTPRAKKQQRPAPAAGSAPALVHSSTNTASADGDTLSLVSSSKSKATSSRSSSPTKRKRDLQFTSPKVTFHERAESLRRQDDLEQQSRLFQQLVDNITLASTQLPVEMKPFLVKQHDPLLGKMSNSFSTNLSQFARLEDYLLAILKETEYCTTTESDEDNWIKSVVDPVLGFTAKLYQEIEVRVIGARDIRIAPADLIPKFYESERTVGTNRVDRVLGIRLRDESILTLENHRSISQSIAPDVTHQMLFSDVEVKSSRHTSDSEGLAQMGVWLAAGHTKLVKLAKEPPGTRSDPLPVPHCLWLWTRDRVTLHVALETSVDHIEVFRQRTFETSSAESLLQLTMTLWYVMKWAHECYMPWFEEHTGQVSTA